MTVQTLERPNATVQTEEREHVRGEQPVPVKQLLRWQDDGGAIIPPETA